MSVGVILQRGFDRKYLKSSLEWTDDLMDALVFHLIDDTVEPEVAKLTTIYGAEAIRLPDCPSGDIAPFKNALQQVTGWDQYSNLCNAEHFIERHNLQNEYREFLMLTAYAQLKGPQ